MSLEKIENRYFWMQKLEGFRSHQRFFFERPSKEKLIQSFQLSIDATKSMELFKLSKENDLSLFLLMGSLLSIQLKRFLKESDILMSVPVPEKIDESKVLLPLRLQVDSKNTFRQQISDFKNEYSGAVMHRGYFSGAEKALETQSSFVFASSQVHGKQWYDNFIHSEELQLGLCINRTEIGIELLWAYNAKTIEFDFAKSFAHVFLDLVGEPSSYLNCKISEVSFNKNLPVKRVGPEFNHGEFSSLVEMVEKAALLHPEKIAIIQGNSNLTYAELMSGTNEVAKYLVQRNLKSQSVVAAVFSRHVDGLIAMLGIMKAGLIYLPLDLAWPTERINQILKDCDAQLCVTNSERNLLDVIAGVPVIDTKQMRKSSQNLSYEIKEVEIKPTSGCYIIYTSGSTGIPKGALVTHEAISKTVKWRLQESPLNSSDVCIQTFAYCFDGFFASFFCPIIAGATIIQPSEYEIRDPKILVGYISKHKATDMIAVPTLYSAIVDAAGENQISSLRSVTLAGEAVSKNLATKSKTLYPHIELQNMYGPTEVTVYATLARDLQPDRITIGPLIGDTYAYILDEDLNPCPPGCPGELFLGGGRLSQGYINRPDLTEARFIKDPFNSNQLVYRTSDICFWDTKGHVFYVGRNDHQVKVRGYRIELGEIQSQLLEDSNLNDVFVSVTGDPARIVAAFTADKQINSQSVLESLRNRLPDYMVPTTLVQLEKFPNLTSGKVNAGAILAEIERITEASEIPQSATESAVCEIMAKILERKNVGRRQSFFAAGGHSLNASTLAFELSKRFGVKIQMSDIFGQETSEKLAQLIVESSKYMSLTVPKADHREFYPVSSSQKRVYLAQEMDDTGVAHNMGFAFELNKIPSVERLSKAANEIVARHESLRTSFLLDGKRVVQKIHESANIQIEIFEIKDLSELEKTFHNFIRPFDLKQPPLFRVALVRTPYEKHYLFFDFHHIAVDGQSVALIFEEFGLIYAENNELAPVEFQFKDYLVWRDQTSTEQTAAKTFWQKNLENPPEPIELVLDQPRKKQRTKSGAKFVRKIDKHLLEKLQTLSKTLDSTLFQLMLAANWSLLSQYSRAEDFIVGIPLGGRDLIGKTNVVGMAVNVIPLRLKFSPKGRFVDFLQALKRQLLQAISYQEYPIEELFEQYKSEERVSRLSPYDCVFTFQNFEMKAPSLGNDVILKQLDLFDSASKFDLTMTVEKGEEDSRLLIEYATDLFSENKISLLAEHYLNILESIAVDPNCSILDLNCLNENEMRRHVLGFNDIYREFPEEHTILSLYNRSIEKYPHKVALRWNNETMTYSQLNHRVQEIAENILGRIPNGTEPISICLPRSFDLIATIMAVLQLGRPYLPIEASTPKARIDYMLKDSNAALLVTTESVANELALEFPHVLLLDQISTLNRREFKAVSVSPQSPAYIIYTSGSTGMPKGVLVSHDNVVRLFLATEATFEFSHEDVWSLFHSYAFDVSVWEIFGALLYGGSLVIVPKEVVRDPSKSFEVLKNEKVSILNFTPLAFYEFIESQDFIWSSESLSIRKVVSCGDKLDVSKLKPWFASPRKKEMSLINMYGITETTVHVTIRAITEEDMLSGITGSPIGPPMDDLRVYLLNDNLQPVPTGVVGEIFVGGRGVTLGYLNREELNTTRFIPNPFHKGEKLYRSGDLAYFGLDGEMYYMRRSDHQVKVRGHRIEKDEVRSALLKNDRIKDAVVRVRESSKSVGELVAYIVPQSLSDVSSPDEIKHDLATRLPDYMIPTKFWLVERIALNTNGKLDAARMEASAISLDGEESNQDEVATSPLETLIMGVFKSVLEVKNIGRSTSFFAAGGDSLKVVMIVRTLRLYGYQLSVADVFREQTVSALAQFISQGHLGGTMNAPDLSLLKISNDLGNKLTGIEYEDVFPASSMQETMVREYSACKDRAEVYHTQLSLRLGVHRFDLSLFKQALAVVIQKHPSLRTKFLEGKEGSLYQVILKHGHFDLEFRDLSHQSEQEAQKILNSYFEIDREKPFEAMNLQEPSMIRGAVFKLSDDTIDFIYSLHHAIEDGWGNVEMLKDLFGTYSQLSGGKESIEIAKKENVYREFVALEIEKKQDTTARDYWKSISNSVKTIEPSPIHEKTNSQKRYYSTGDLRIPSELGGNAFHLARMENVQLKVVFLSVYFELIKSLFGAANNSIGVVTSGRSAELSDPFGGVGLYWNINPYVLEDLSEVNSKERLQSLQKFISQSEAHSTYPLQQMLDDSRKSSLFWAVFNFTYFHNGDGLWGGESLEILDSKGVDNFHYPLFIHVSVNPSDDSIDLRITGNLNYFTQSQIDDMVNKFIEISQHVIDRH